MSAPVEGREPLAHDLTVIVCGGRDYADRARVWDELDRLHYGVGIATLVHGNCPSGADRIADDWACAHGGVNRHRVTADWKKHGRAAGPIRNARMLAEAQPDLVLAFPGGRGTDDMVRKAMAAGVTVIQIPAAPSPAGQPEGSTT